MKLFGKGDVIRTLDVWKGASRTLKAGSTADVYVTVPKGEAGKLQADTVSQQPLSAPVAQDERVGTLRVTLEGRPIAEFPLVALEPVGPAGLLGRAWDTLRLWIK